MPSIALENNELKPVEPFQAKKKVKVGWDTLPNGGRILVHYYNGIYIGVERDDEGNIGIIYTSRITSTEKGETIFGSLSKNEERSLVKYENKI